MKYEKRAKRKNLMGKPPLKVQCIKNEEGKTIAKKLCSSLQEDHVGSGTFS